MSHVASSPVSRSRGARRRRSRSGPLLTITAAAVGLCAWAILLPPSPGRPVASVTAAPPSAPVKQASAPSPVPAVGWMLDPTPALGSQATTFRRATAVQAALRPAEAGPASGDARAAEPVQALAAAPPAPARLVQTIPVPIPRPAEFRRAPVPETPRLASRPVSPSTQSVFRAAAVDNRSFVEKLFGVEPSSTGPALAYAGTSPDLVDPVPRRRLSPSPVPPVAANTAVYDISARKVYLPNGEELEAHSGLGSSMDDPRYVHLRMRGATPPGTYDLREREALFHGVRAIRLNPVGGPAAVHGRNGLLAHTYMLGASGASNGCVSFRNYDRFLQAYLRGEVQRLVVVAGRGQDGPPATGTRLFGLLGR
ncbi:DUF2778 domain-containing protein [Methylobacterium soli]|uniref:DUF2778 domain-containing protein n=1 Tax=Methylobacterium soli TaxID=553447 RepID=A0A6L3T588_9HYPH|nr:DUF2778 domain-containing protein [Methylobacterium soli]KAB1078513.1 DUF2778 domain-containing protein [Methylobacterium soli]GJE41983.1 hypothetical protein AEGHOMDF_1153 [Methylobacterium soli]